MKKRWRWFWRIASTLFLLLAILGACSAYLANSWRNVPVTPATTRLTAPLAPDGFPDYLAALNAQMSVGVTESNNAAPAFYAILAPEKIPAAWIPLLAASHPSTDHHFIRFHQWCLDHPNLLPPADQTSEDDFESEQYAQTGNFVWSAPDHPTVAGYLEANNVALDALESLTTRDRFYLPFVTSDDFPKGASRPALLNVDYPFSAPREAGRAMLQRAMLRCQQHNYSGFESDVTASLQLSYLIVQQPSLFHYLVACSIHGASLVAIAQASLDPEMPADVLQNLQTMLDRLPPWPTPAHLLDTTDRYTLLENVISCLDVVKHNPAVSGASAPPAPGTDIPLLPIHFAHALTETNRFYDAWRDAFDLPLYADRYAAIKRTDDEVDSIGSTGILEQISHSDMYLIVRRLCTLDAQPLNRFMTLAATSHRLTRTSLAIARYRRAHGDLPKSLAELSLPADIPTDPFSNKPFIYKPTSAPYILYSVGPNMTDDGGMFLEHYDSSKPSDISAFPTAHSPSKAPCNCLPPLDY